MQDPGPRRRAIRFAAIPGDPAEDGIIVHEGGLEVLRSAVGQMQHERERGRHRQRLELLAKARRRELAGLVGGQREHDLIEAAAIATLVVAQEPGSSDPLEGDDPAVADDVESPGEFPGQGAHAGAGHEATVLVTELDSALAAEGDQAAGPGRKDASVTERRRVRDEFGITGREVLGAVIESELALAPGRAAPARTPGLFVQGGGETGLDQQPGTGQARDAGPDDPDPAARSLPFHDGRSPEFPTLVGPGFCFPLQGDNILRGDEADRAGMSDLERVQSLTLEPLLDLRRYVGDGPIHAFQLGPDGLYWLAVETRVGTGRRLRVLAIGDEGPTVDIQFMAPPFETHLVQPLGSRILVACSRCGCGAGAMGTCAAAIYERDGRFVRALNLGEGIANLQASPSGYIWAGYLAEGDFDSYAWTRPSEQPGLAGWAQDGSLDWVFSEQGELEELDDCYALNVASEDEVWFLHFPRFALVRLHRKRVAGVWDLPLAGGCTFAVADGVALIRGDETERDHFQVVALRPDNVFTAMGAVRFIDPEGRSLGGARTSARGGELALLHSGRIFRYDARSAAVSLSLT